MAVLWAMGTDITLAVAAPPSLAARPLELARNAFTRVEAACSRVDPTSPLMVVNAAPAEWHVVPPECFAVIDEAARAHLMTGGLFDPRVSNAPYDRSLDVTTVPVKLVTTPAPGSSDRGADPTPWPRWRPWRPDLDADACAVRLGNRPVDLGGIDKGLAVRWAAAELAATGAPFMVEAGGDITVGGVEPDGDGWLIGVEDPVSRRGTAPAMVAVLRLFDAACSTSSVHVRTWTANGRPVHHLIDPGTGDRCESALCAVTVVDPDAARAEAWSKSLLLMGAEGVAETCRIHDLAALWVDVNGAVDASTTMRPHIIWQLGENPRPEVV